MSDEIHVSTKETPGDYDAFETAKPGEPIFTLQGGDPFAPKTVQCWADLAREESRSLVYGPRDLPEGETYSPTEEQRSLAEKLLRKATSAEEVSWAMIAYQRGHVDAAPEVRARYNEDQPAIASEVNDERKLRIATVSTLHNALSIANDAAEALDKANILPAAVREIKDAVGTLRLVADAVEPRRGMERS